jgi:hypothetical protein
MGALNKTFRGVLMTDLDDVSEVDLQGLRDFVVRNEVVSGGDELYAIVAELWPKLLHKVEASAIIDALMGEQTQRARIGSCDEAEERPDTPKDQHIIQMRGVQFGLYDGKTICVSGWIRRGLDSDCTDKRRTARLRARRPKCDRASPCCTP